MTREDARYYVKNFNDLQREIVASANGLSPTLLYAIAEQNGCKSSKIRREADHLEAMNLLEIKQSRVGGQFFHNYVILNERGLQVQALVLSAKTRK